MSSAAPLAAPSHRAPDPATQPSGAAAAWSAAAVTVPHAVGLGLLAFAPLAGDYSLAALALWSAALPGLLLTLLAPRAGVVYAPTTVVALLFAAVLATAHGAAPALGLSARQVLAVSGAMVALAFVFQWLLGVLRLASVARFLPVSVTHGFAAGVGLSMVVGQVRNGFGAGGDALWNARTQSQSVAEAITVPLSGWLAQRFGAVKVFVFGLVGFGVFSILCGLAPTFGFLVFARVLQGLCGGPIMPMSQLCTSKPPLTRL